MEAANKRGGRNETKGLWRALSRYAAGTMTVGMHFLFGHDIMYRLIGFCNKHLFRWVHDVVCFVLRIDHDYLENPIVRSCFLVYGFDQEKRRLFLLDWLSNRLNREEWELTPVNIFFQNGRIGLVWATAALQHQFLNPREIEEMKTRVEKLGSNHPDYLKEKELYEQALEDTRMMLNLSEKLERIQRLVGATQSSAAGILPGRWSNHQVDRGQWVERENTIVSVRLAINKVKAKYSMPHDSTVVLIGGKGYIGPALSEQLITEDDCMVIMFDLENIHEFPSLARVAELNNTPMVIVNLASPEALDKWIDYLWEDCYVLNEVYPMFGRKTISRFSDTNVRVGHIAGAEGYMMFSLGRGYWKKIPCCGTFTGSKNFDIVVKELTGRDKGKYF